MNCNKTTYQISSPQLTLEVRDVPKNYFFQAVGRGKSYAIEQLRLTKMQSRALITCIDQISISSDEFGGEIRVRWIRKKKYRFQALLQPDFRDILQSRELKRNCFFPNQQYGWEGFTKLKSRDSQKEHLRSLLNAFG